MEVRLRLRLRDVCGRGAAALPATAGGLSWQPNRSVTRRTARIAREVYSVWYGRVGTTNYVPAEKVQQLFNDLQLYPSKSQVYEMLQCAKECAGRSSAAYLTFGEFCIFATELKRCYERGIPRPVQLSRLLERDGEEKKRRNRKMSKGIPKYEVFLGGSCNPTTWRQDVAIPTLKDLGITYYNPQVSHWGPELIELEYQAKQNATVLFFVIDNQTRSVASMIEAAHISGRRRKLILVIHPFQGPGQCIWGESITDEEFEDLMMGQMMLQDLVERQGIPVFESIPIALNCTAKVLRENLSVQDLGLQDYAQPVKMAHVQLGDKLIKLREAFDALDTSNSGEISIADVCMGFRVLTNRNLSNSEVRNLVANQTGLPGETHGIPLDQLHVNFEQFCAIVAEFKCGESEVHKLWDVVLAKTTRLLQAIVSPLTKALEWTMSPQPLRSLQISTPQNGQNNCARDVYLGGTCQNTTWRDDIAIPILKKNGLTYFNPQQCRWSSRLIPIEAAAMDNSYVLLFVITNTSRSLASMAMAAHYIGLGCNVVLCVQHLPDDCIFGSDKLTKQAIKDYNRGRMYLSDLANREEGVQYASFVGGGSQLFGGGRPVVGGSPHSVGRTPSPMDYVLQQQHQYQPILLEPGGSGSKMHHDLIVQGGGGGGRAFVGLPQGTMQVQQMQSPVCDGAGNILDLDSQHVSLGQIDSGDLASLGIFDNNLSENLSNNLNLGEPTGTSMTDSLTRITNNALQELCSMNSAMYKGAGD